MPAVDVGAVSLIQEFRLRKWAREHYVSREQRGKNWHPIVLQEMEFRDAELIEAELRPDVAYSPLVPLAPSENGHFDAAHATVPPPKSSAMPVEPAWRLAIDG